MSYLKVTAIGNLGRDAATRYTPNGDAVADFSIACSSKEKGETVTQWLKVTLWGKRAESLSQYLLKGKQVFIEGRLKETSYTDKDGHLRHVLEVNATEVQLLGGRSEGDAPPQARAAAQGAPSKDDDEIPF